MKAELIILTLSLKRISSWYTDWINPSFRLNGIQIEFIFTLWVKHFIRLKITHTPVPLNCKHYVPLLVRYEWWQINCNKPLMTMWDSVKWNIASQHCTMRLVEYCRRTLNSTRGSYTNNISKTTTKSLNPLDEMGDSITKGLCGFGCLSFW